MGSARFTDIGKWRDKWFRRLSIPEKLLFMYLCDSCDIAGFVEIDIELFAFETGLPQEDVEGALKGLARGLVQKGSTIWLKNFLKHQRNLPLNPENRCHKGIISSLVSHADFHSEIRGLEGASDTLIRVLGIGIGKGIGMEGEEECRGEEEGSKGNGKAARFAPPTPEELSAYCEEKGYTFDQEQFLASNENKDWLLTTGKKMKNWRLACVSWQKNKESGIYSGRSSQPDLIADDIMGNYDR